MVYGAPNIPMHGMASSSRVVAPIACRKCGAVNPPTAARCQSCSAALSSKAPPTPPGTASPFPDLRRYNLDAIFDELEALTREDDAPAVQFQCPECGRLVEEAAAQCRCGAVFMDPTDVLGYECPVCGARVAGDARACRCGAQFSD